jgi:hypothetical protein
MMCTAASSGSAEHAVSTRLIARMGHDDMWAALIYQRDRW